VRGFLSEKGKTSSEGRERRKPPARSTSKRKKATTSGRNRIFQRGRRKVILKRAKG